MTMLCGYRCVLLTIALWLGFAEVAQSQEQNPPGFGRGSWVVAQVNGEPVTRYELESEVRRQLLEKEIQSPLSEDELRQISRIVLDDMIDRRLLLQQCAIQKIEVTDPELEAHVRYRVQELRSQGQKVSSVNDFYRYMFKRTGEKEDDLRERLREFLRIQKLLRKVIQSEYITPRELRSFYLANSELFKKPSVYTVRFLILPRGSETEFETTIRAVEAAVADGTDFVEIMKRYSPASRRDNLEPEVLEDGQLNDYTHPIPDTIRSLKSGQVSPPLFFATNAVFIKLENVEEGSTLEFETPEAQRLIQTQITRQQRARQQAAFLKEIRESATIIPDYLKEPLRLRGG